jgi:hypothetical protein
MCEPDYGCFTLWCCGCQQWKQPANVELKDRSCINHQHYPGHVELLDHSSTANWLCTVTASGQGGMPARELSLSKSLLCCVMVLGLLAVPGSSCGSSRWVRAGVGMADRHSRQAMPGAASFMRRGWLCLLGRQSLWEIARWRQMGSARCH